MITPEDVLFYFKTEIPDFPETNVKITVDGDEVRIQVKEFIDGGMWCEIMDWVDAMDGEWNKGQPKGFWSMPVDRIDYRISDARAEVSK